MQKADIISRSVSAFIDLLIVIALSRFPDVLGFLSAGGYILVRDGIFGGRSVGKKLGGVAVALETGGIPNYRDSLVRNSTLAATYLLFLIPYAGWLLGPIALAVECLTALGDDKGRRIGDLLAGTQVVTDKGFAEKTAPGKTSSGQVAAGIQDGTEDNTAS